MSVERAGAEELEVGAHDLLLAQELRQCEDHVRRGDAGLRPARELDTDDVRQPHPRGTAEHDVLGLETTDSHRDHAQCIDVRRVAVGAHECVREGDAILRVNDGRHPLQVDLVHDAVARRDHVDVGKRPLGPLDEVEAVLVAPILDRAVLRERVLVEATVFDRQRVVDDQLHRHDRVHLRRITALLRNRIAQPGKIDERRLSEDVVADDARRKPREIEIPLALDQLAQVRHQHLRLRAAYEVLGVHPRRVRQLVVSAGFDRVDGGARVVEVQ